MQLLAILFLFPYLFAQLARHNRLVQLSRCMFSKLEKEKVKFELFLLEVTVTFT